MPAQPLNERVAAAETNLARLPIVEAKVDAVAVELATIRHALDLAIAKMVKAIFQGAMVATAGMVCVAIVAFLLAGAFNLRAQARTNPTPTALPSRGEIHAR